MTLIKTNCCSLVVCLFTGMASFAQTASPLTGNDDQNISRMIDIYHLGAGANDPLFNGREYERLSFYINKGIPYYVADTLKNGTVVYDGLNYNNVPLLYDQVVDELVTLNFTGQHLIKLVKQKVDSFFLYGTKFIPVQQADKTVSDGYYELLYDGSSQLLRKEIKRVTNNIRYGQQLERNIESKITYLVKHNNRYYTVASTNSLVNVFSDKEAIKKIISDNRKKYKNADLKVGLMDALMKYDQLTK